MRAESFNSRTREGCDYRFNPFRLLAYQFQFTHPGGVRLLFAISHLRIDTFQFTHPGGVRRHLRTIPCTAREVSIHAPGRGATILQRVTEITIGVSIHAPGRGATISRSHWTIVKQFQFTHPGGVRLNLQ